MTHAKFNFNQLMLTLIFGILASELPPPQAWRTTEKAGPDRVKVDQVMFNSLVLTWERNFEVTFGIFSVLVLQISVLESYLDIYMF